MAVTTTPEHILDAAYAKSAKNNPGAIATEETELLNLVNRMLRKFYIIAARINPTFFAQGTPVVAPGAGNPWARPEGAELVYRLDAADGSQIVLVPHDDRTAESGRAAVYREGKAYYAAGNANDPDPATDPITFWYSKRPDTPASVSAFLDQTWEEQFNELLILETAIFLAIKDSGSTGRDVEIAHLKDARDEWVRLFALFLEHETVNERRRFGHVLRINPNTLVPLNTLLAGGSSVEI